MDDSLRLDHAQNLFNLGKVDSLLRGHAEAVQNFKGASTECRNVIKRNPWDFATRLLLVKCLYETVPPKVVLTDKVSEEIDTLLLEASEMAAILVDFDRETAKKSSFLISVHADYADLLYEKGDLEGAWRELSRGTTVMELALEATNPDVRVKEQKTALSIVAMRIALILAKTSQYYFDEFSKNEIDTAPLGLAEKYLDNAKTAIDPYRSELSAATMKEEHRNLYSELEIKLKTLDALLSAAHTNHDDAK